MVIDTSAIVAILCNEPAARELEQAIAADSVRLMSSASLLEASIVAEARYGDEGGRELDLLVYKAHIDVIAFSAEQVEIARAAFRRFGKGRHAARLNFGDCFAYALAREAGEPLLF